MLNILILVLVLMHFSENLTAVSDLRENQKSCFVSRELEDECAAVCYPIVKPLLKSLGICQQRDLTMHDMQKQVQDQNYEAIKWKTQVDLLKKQLGDERSSSELKLELQESLDGVHNLIMELSGELKELGRQKDNTINDLKKQLTSKDEQLKHKEKNIIEKDKLLQQKEQYIKQKLDNEARPKSCPTLSNETHTIQGPEEEPDTSDWTVILQENEGYTSLVHKLEQHKEKSFRDPNGSFFIGLKNMYQMTQKRHNIHIKVKLVNGSTRSLRDISFIMDKESYKITIIKDNLQNRKYSIVEMGAMLSMSPFMKHQMRFGYSSWEKMTIMFRPL